MIVISFVIMTAFSYSLSKNNLESAIFSNMQSQAKNNSRILAEQLNVYKAIITEVSMNDIVRSMDWNSQKTVLENEVKANSVMLMGAASINGNINYTNNAKANIKECEYFKTALNGKVFISDPMMDTVENKLVVILSSPIMDDSENVCRRININCR